MKKVIKSIMLLTVASLVFSSLSGCGPKQGVATKELQGFNQTGYPICKEPYTLKVAVSLPDGALNPKELKVWKDLEAKTNVNIEWITAPSSSWAEKKNLMFASGDLPDLFVGNWILEDKDLLIYGEDGLLLPVENIIDKYSVYLKKDLEARPDIKKLAMTKDNHLYALPIYEDGELVSTTQTAFYINQKWLKKLNLAVPTTTEEFYTVLKAFKDNDLNGNNKKDEIPFTFSKTIPDLYGPFGYIDNQNHLIMKDDKVTFIAEQPEYKEAITWMNKLFSEGLIDQEAFTQSSAIYNAKLKSKERTVGAFFAWRDSAWQLNAQDDEYIPILPLKGPQGYQYSAPRTNGFRGRSGVAITSACKNPEVAMRWADELYNPEAGISGFVIGYNVELTPENKLRFITTNPEQDKYNISAVTLYNSLPGKGYQFENLPEYRVQKAKLDKIYEKYLPPHKPVVTSNFGLQEIQQIATLQTDINKFVEDRSAKWMMSGGIENEWDGYIKKMYDMKLDELKKLYQNSYDEYMKK